MPISGQRHLLERDAELERIEALLAAVGDGCGRGLVVEGPAGIGKSTLLGAATELARGRSFAPLAARGGELERDFGYGVVRQLLEPVVRRASPERLGELLRGAASLAAPIVAAEEVDAAPLPAGPDAAFAAQHGLYWLVDNLAAERPVLLVVDDAHWADPASVRFLLYLAARLDGMAAGLLIGWRTGEPGASVELLQALRDEPLIESIHPGILSPTATGELIRAELKAGADTRFCRACHSTTGGNPFLLTQLLTAVSQGELPPTAEAVERVRELGPAAVSQSVFARLSRLSEDARRVARAVAVLDVDSDPRHVAALAGLHPEPALTAIAELEQAGIFGEGAQPRFAHPILRGAVYGDLGRAEQERSHRAAARILDEAGAGDRAAAHLLLTQPAGDPWVLERLVGAGERAIQCGAADTANALARRALAEPPGRARARVLFLLGTAELLAASPTATDHLRAAMEASDDPELRRNAAMQLARQLNIHLRHAEAVQVFESVLEEQRQLGSTQDLEIEAHIAYYGLMADASAPAAGERIERIAQTCTGETVAEGMILVAAAFHRALARKGTAAEVVDLIDRARVSERFVTMLSSSSTAFWACAALVCAGRLDEARVLADELMTEARRTGGALWVGAASNWRGLAAYLLGDLRDADAYLDESLDVAGKFPLSLPIVVAGAAEMLRLRGKIDAADTMLAGYGFAEAPAPRYAFSQYLPALRAALRIEQRRPAAARTDAEALLQSERERGGVIPGVLPAAALALHAAGDTEAALEVAHRELKVSDRWGVDGHRGAALRALGMIEGGAGGLDRFRESVAALEETPFRLEHALSLVEYGSALRRANQRRAARDPLATGRELAQRCGATALAARAEEELLAMGARTRSFATTGVDSLTASERRVAQFAAKGLTNREIAQTLFVTKKTVETHLRHVFQKLDVKARSELPSALEVGALAGPEPVTPAVRVPDGNRLDLDHPVVRTVLISDIVDSTRRQSQLGDRRWRDLQNRFEDLVRTELGRFAGDQIKGLGDGFLATFESATAAVRCAQALSVATATSLGLTLRSGIHCGEVELRDGDVHGIAVTIAARVTSLAGAGEVLCSGTVVDLAVGSDLRFLERAPVALKGVPGRWRIGALL